MKHAEVPENKEIFFMFSKNKEMLYGFEHNKTDKIDKCFLIGCESDEINERNNFFQFLVP